LNRNGGQGDAFGGTPLEVVSEILGQSWIAISDDSYAHVSPDARLPSTCSPTPSTGNRSLSATLSRAVDGVSRTCRANHAAARRRLNAVKMVVAPHVVAWQ
jgi:hypothetical protein